MQTEIYSKNSREKISPYLFVKEVACRCDDVRCHYTLFHPKTNHSFHLLRSHINYPLIITSGFRCKTHNEKVGGLELSSHTVGRAVDIICPEKLCIKSFAEIVRRYFDVGIIYEEDNFVHCHNN